jgi:hypothetical protein
MEHATPGTKDRNEVELRPLPNLFGTKDNVLGQRREGITDSGMRLVTLGAGRPEGSVTVDRTGTAEDRQIFNVLRRSNAPKPLKIKNQQIPLSFTSIRLGLIS